MIVENERDLYTTNFDYTDDQLNLDISQPEIHRNRLVGYNEYVRNHSRIRNRSINNRLQADLVEEIWNRFGTEGSDD